MNVTGRGDGRGGRFYPVGGDQLSAVPTAFVEHEQAETGHVAGGEPHGVFAEAALWHELFLLFGGLIVLHAEGVGEIGLESLIDAMAGELFEGDAGSIEVPVVINIIGSGGCEPRLGM